MKTALIILSLFAASVWATEKKAELKRGKRTVDEKLLESMTSEVPSEKTHSREAQALHQDRSHQIDAKRVRQYQEERQTK